MISAWILWREAFGFVIARRPEADVAISQDPAGSWGSYRRMRWPYAAGRRGRRPLQGVCARRACPEICNCQRRSLSAATDAIGACHFDGGLYGLQVQRRERHDAPLQWRMRSAEQAEICNCQRRSLSAATDAIGWYVLSAPCTNWKCLPEIATGAKRPRNDTSGRVRCTSALLRLNFPVQGAP